MNKTFLLFLFTVAVAGVGFFGCAKEAPRTDVTLELTSPDTIEALVEKDLVTVGTSYQDIDSQPESTPAEVTYVDSVEMQKPVSVVNDDTLYQNQGETAAINDMDVPKSNITVWGPESDKTLESLDNGSVSVVAPPTGDLAPSGESSSSTQTQPMGEAATLNPRPASQTPLVPTRSGYIMGGNQGAGTAPGPMASSAPASSASGKSYTVVAGDNLIKIAKRNGVKVNDICQANGISRSTVLKVGQTLTIPGAASQAAPAADTASLSASTASTETSASISSVVKPMDGGAPAPAAQTAPAASNGGTHTVVAGDSYWKLARQYGTTVEELMSLNGTSSDRLRIGQTIKVPQR